MTQLEGLKLECANKVTELDQLRQRIKNLTLLKKLGIDEEYRVNQLKSTPLLNDLMKTRYSCNEENVIFSYYGGSIPNIDYLELQKIDFIGRIEIDVQRHPYISSTIMSSTVTIHFKEEKWEDIKNA